MNTFRADCSNCCGLCCVVPDQMAIQGFRIDKPAETPCAYLNDHHRCSIHAQRRIHGYPACESFDCFGAGQWVTQRLFGGAKWTDSPDLASQMFAAYRHWVPRFAAAALIEAALPYVREDARCSLVATMKDLTNDEATRHLNITDGLQLRRETLSVIRSALKVVD
ncbi:MAG TPA: hypothetical protein VG962_14930 [Steroidobacteraceae bacterium]|nr:hypothetical protein [Steroidobacteraceae bacterium]